VRHDEQQKTIENVWKLAASPQMKSNGSPPRILDHVIEMMLPFAALGRFNFDA
jgi:ribosomal protein L13